MLFPTPPFNITVWPSASTPTAANAEIMRVTAKSTDTFTVTRNAEAGGSLLSTIAVAYQVAQTITAGTFADYLALTGGVVSGAVNMNSNKVTNLANGTAASDAAAFGQIPTTLNQLPLTIPAAGNVSGGLVTLTSTQTQAVGDAVRIHSSGQATLAFANVIANASAVLLAAAAVSGSASNSYLLPNGIVRLASSPSWTVGGLVYLSLTGTTGNTMTQTPPSGSGNVIQILGVALAADTLLFAPDLSQVEHV